MIAAIFPGQGSQRPGMGKELHDSHAEAYEVFSIVSDAVGVDLRRLCFDSDEETLRRTENTQIALYTCSVAAYRCLPEPVRQRVGAMAGHSVGEYAALACAGALDIGTGARLVRKRGELMARSGETRPGTMAAVIGLERDALESACRGADGVVVVANDNCPGQLVISGEVDAVRRAGELAAAAGAKRVLPLNVSGAFHSPLMEEPAKQLAQDLATASFTPSEGVKVYSNVTARPESDWPRLLEAQLRSPVRWTETIENLIEDGYRTFVECGVGEVLSGLIRRIDKTVSTHRVNDDASLANAIHDLMA